MPTSSSQIAKLRAALAEVLARRSLFSDETYTQIVLAIYDRIRAVQSRPEDVSADLLSNDEIRLVTVMFIDVVASTQIMSEKQFEVDDWKQVIGGAHMRLSAVLNEWGGEIGQYLGDGLLCFFGAHHSQPDDAVRAVYCALVAQEVMRDYAEELEAQFNIQNFAVRIGISTGRAIVGMMGDENKSEILALGTPTNLASRLQTLCEPGKVLIDAQTYQQVRLHFEFVEHPLASLKGFEKPVVLYTVLRRRQLPAAQLTFNRVAGIETPFVGRESEIELLQGLARQSLDDRQPRLATVIGEIGLGKSRLLQEVLLRIQQMSFFPLILIGSYEKRQTSHNLVHDLLAVRCGLKENTPRDVAEHRIEQYIRDSWPESEAEAAAHIIGFVANYGFDDSPHVHALRSSGVDINLTAFRWISHWFSHLARQQPLIIVVDNLQWADYESLAMLEYLARDFAAQPGVIIGAARPEFVELFPSYMKSLDHHLVLSLEPLSEPDMLSMIGQILRRVDNVPAQLAGLIGERAEGNPLFVEEFLHMLFDNGVFEATSSDRWQVNRYLFTKLAFDLPPDGLLALLQARLDELPPAARRVVQSAAVIGHNFWFSAVESIANLNPLRRELNDLEARGIVIHELKSSLTGEQEYRFRHTLYREVAYAMLTRPVREAYHREAAAWLAAHISDRPEYMSMLADHYWRGGMLQEALRTYLAAAQDRFERGLLRESLQLAKKGQEIAPEVPREISLPIVSRLWMLQGQALDALDQYDEASAASRNALMLMEELPTQDVVDEQVISAMTLGSAYLSLGGYDKAFEALRIAHTLLPKENVQQQAKVLRTLGALFRSRGELDESFPYLRQSLELAQQSSDRREVATITALLGSNHLDRGNFEGALTAFEQALAVNRDADNLYFQIHDLSNLAESHRLLFAAEPALNLCAEAEQLGARVNHLDPMVTATKGLCLIALGQPEGMTLLQEVAMEDRQNALTRQRIHLSFVVGLAMVEDYGLCWEAAQSLVDSARGQNQLIYGRALLWLGMAQKGLGENRDARVTLNEALKTERRYGGRDLWLCHYALGEASARRDDIQKHFQNAIDELYSIAKALYNRPALQASVLKSSIMRDLIERTPSHKQRQPSSSSL